MVYLELPVDHLMSKLSRSTTRSCQPNKLLINDIGSYRNSRPEVFCKKVFLKISQNLQEKTCARVSFLLKLQA